jgi:hypothetical protein
MGLTTESILIKECLTGLFTCGTAISGHPIIDIKGVPSRTESAGPQRRE